MQRLNKQTIFVLCGTFIFSVMFANVGLALADGSNGADVARYSFSQDTTYPCSGGLVHIDAQAHSVAAVSGNGTSANDQLNYHFVVTQADGTTYRSNARVHTMIHTQGATVIMSTNVFPLSGWNVHVLSVTTPSGQTTSRIVFDDTCS